MGWMEYPLNKQDERAEIERICTFEQDGVIQRPVAMSKKGSAYYVAVESSGKDPGTYVADADGRYVFAVVILTSWRNGLFAYKPIEESMGPHYYEAPAKVLDALSGTSNEYAQKWRAACRRRHVEKRRAANLKPGDRIRLAEPVYLAGEAERDFTVTTYTRRGKARRAYHNARFGLVRLAPDHLTGFELIEAASEPAS